MKLKTPDVNNELVELENAIERDSTYSMLVFTRVIFKKLGMTPKQEKELINVLKRIIDNK